MARARIRTQPWLVLLALVAAGACGPRHGQETWWGRSPDGKAVLSLSRADRQGAFGDFEYQVSVSKPLGVGPGGVLWRSTGCRPIYLFWLTETAVEIFVDESDARCRGVSKGHLASGSWKEFTLVARALPGWSKDALWQ